MELGSGTMRSSKEDRMLVDDLKLQVTKIFSQHADDTDFDNMMETLRNIRSRLIREDGFQHTVLRGVEEAMAKMDICDLRPHNIAAHLAVEFDCHPWHGL